MKTVKICWQLGAPPPDPLFAPLCQILGAPLNSGGSDKEKSFDKHCNVYARKRLHSVHNFVKICFKNFAIPVVNIHIKTFPENFCRYGTDGAPRIWQKGGGRQN